GERWDVGHRGTRRRDVVQEALDERLAPLHVGDHVRRDARLVSGPADDVLVDQAPAEPLGDFGGRRERVRSVVARDTDKRAVHLAALPLDRPNPAGWYGTGAGGRLLEDRFVVADFFVDRPVGLPAYRFRVGSKMNAGRPGREVG